ncbi:MAG: tetratricopeptide repeat protein [Candidatus Veblenbacteria bacterium]|nr:tetratricopeptide repeat protein [Candidatus Veblenbacteria bacterium]
MALDAVLGLLFLGGLAGLIALVVRKLPVLRLTNPSEVVKFREQEVKQHLVAGRLKRQLVTLGRRVVAVFGSSSGRKRGTVRSLPQRLGELGEHLQQSILERTSPKRTMADYLRRAEEALAQEKYIPAEEAYLEVLRLDPHHLLAYQGLGEVYLEQRDFEAAREVYEYLLQQGRTATSSLGLARVASGQGRLEEARDEYLGAMQLTSLAQPRLELAHILCELGDAASALKYLKEARKIEPQNPKTLDFFIEVSILNGQSNLAQEGLAALREANPENQKIAEFARAIRELEHKTKPKRSKSSKGSTSFNLPTGRR